MYPNRPAALVEFLAPYPEHVQELTLASRKILLERFWPVSEIFWDAMSAVCSAFTFTEKPNDSFFNFAVYSDHVTMIFPYGVMLDDPEGRLRGNGSRVRNIRMEGIETLHDPYVLGLVDQAREMAKVQVPPMEPTMIVKVMNGPKRRPAVKT